MLRAAGMFFIMIGAAGLGGYLRSCLRGRLEQLVECRELFAEMDALREYVRLPYEQLLRRTAKGRNSIFAEICNEVADEMEKNENADVKGLWQDSFLKRKQLLYLKEEEIEILSALAKSLMLEGNHAKVAEMYFLQLEDKIVQAMEEKKEKQKLYGSVSVLLGLFLVILLL